MPRNPCLLAKRNHRVTRFLLLLTLLPLGARADFYKCLHNGAITYQQTRCGDAGTGVPSRFELPNSMVGCYLPVRADAPSGGYEIRRIPDAVDEYWYDDDEDVVPRLAESGRGTLWLFRTNRPAGTELALRATSKEEVRSAGVAFQLDLRQGVTFRESPRIHKSYVVPGIYRGKDEAGNDIYYVYFEAEKGLTKKIVCR